MRTVYHHCRLLPYGRMGAHSISDVFLACIDVCCAGPTGGQGRLKRKRRAAAKPRHVSLEACSQILPATQSSAPHSVKVCTTSSTMAQQHAAVRRSLAKSSRSYGRSWAKMRESSSQTGNCNGALVRLQSSLVHARNRRPVIDPQR